MSYEATWTCSCGARNGNDNNFCTTCGSRKPAVTAAPAAAPAGNVCPKCGKTVDAGQTFCIWCGTRVGAAAAPAAPAAGPAVTPVSTPARQSAPRAYSGLRIPTDDDLM